MLILALGIALTIQATLASPVASRDVKWVPEGQVPGAEFWWGFEEIRWHKFKKCLTAPSPPYEGAELYISTCVNSTSQLWTGASNFYSTVLGLMEGHIQGSAQWHVNASSGVNGARPVLFRLKSGIADKDLHYTFSSAPTNRGRIEVLQSANPPVINPQYYTGYCLDVTGGSKDDCTPVQVWQCNKNKNQRWNYYGRTVDGDSLIEEEEEEEANPDD